MSELAASEYHPPVSPALPGHSLPPQRPRHGQQEHQSRHGHQGRGSRDAMPRWVATLAWVNGWANHDFCPKANRYLAWLKSPLTWVTAAALASGLVGAVAAPQGWVVCVALFGTAVLGAIWPWLAIRGVTAELSFERTRCHEGDEVFVELSVANRWPWPVWGLLIEGGIDEDAALARVPAWSTARYRFAWRPGRRGPLPQGVPQVATGFPFGLWMCRRPIAVGRRLVVWPRLTRLRSAPFHRCEHPSIAGGLVDRPGDEGDIVSARPYRPGDSPRRVHWAHTSRRDALIVCERQTASQRRAVVALDPKAVPQSLDAAMRVVASVCLALHRHGWQVVCELEGQPIRISSQPAALRSLWDRLALHGYPHVDAGDEETSMAGRGGLAPTPVGGTGKAFHGQRGQVTACGLKIMVTDEAGWRSRPTVSNRLSSESIRWIVVENTDPIALNELALYGRMPDEFALYKPTLNKPALYKPALNKPAPREHVLREHALRESMSHEFTSCKFPTDAQQADELQAVGFAGEHFASGDRAANGEAIRANGSEIGGLGSEPWISVWPGDGGEQDWMRQWERRCHGDESFA